MSKKSKRILVTGATGQIGSELTPALRKIYGESNVIAGYHKRKPTGSLLKGPCVYIDVCNRKTIEQAIKEYDIDTIYHLAAILSAIGEKNPQLAWRVNVEGLYNVLEVAKEYDLRVFWPSSIAVFGPKTPKYNTPQDTILCPTTMYGITKVTGELLCRYYIDKYGLDIRGVRYPGVISSETLPGGGTTDYAVEMFYAAIKHEKYICFVREDTVLPMMYMPDAIRAAIMLMNADSSKLTYIVGYNVSGVSFSAGELASEIKKYIPDFKVEYKPDFRQKIADSWPKTIDDSVARKEWGWKPKWNLENMVKDMLEKLKRKLLSLT
ncbi:MAG: NAD-dependent epimerase [Thermoprotei archaeon]|nr:MAG: NAD-dependent epimerase [Thermoprotei archaeon]